MVIGICDDTAAFRQMHLMVCDEYFKNNMKDYTYHLFSSGEDVLNYCNNPDTEKIDILFLDIKMPGICGTELKDKLLYEEKIWRIVFVSSYSDYMSTAFSLKTLDFIPKPLEYSRVEKLLNMVYEDMTKNTILTFTNLDNTKIYLHIEDISYFKGNGSYTELYSYDNKMTCRHCATLSKRIGSIEDEYKNYGFLRVHKSYLVNLAHVTDTVPNLYVRNAAEKIELPVGRLYKNKLKDSYLTYVQTRFDKIQTADT